MQSGTNVFLIVSLVIAGFIAALAVGTFLYGTYLDRALAGKQAQLSQAQSQVDENTVEDFVRLRDRLSSVKTLLSTHVVLSQFFDRLEALTLANVRFIDLTLTTAGDNTAQLKMSGTAKSFNALAAQSNAFASEKGIKRAIFSNITLTDKNQVSFQMTADIDSKLILEGNAPLTSAAAPQQQQQQQNVTPQPQAASKTSSATTSTSSAAPKSQSSGTTQSGTTQSGPTPAQLFQ